MSTSRQLRIVTSGTVEPLWEEFSSRLSVHPAFCIIEVEGGGLDLLLAVETEQPAAVILHGVTEANGISSHLFAEYPDLTVLKLYRTGRAFIEQLRLQSREIIPTDPETLSETLRLAVEDPVANRRPT